MNFNASPSVFRKVDLLRTLRLAIFYKIELNRSCKVHKPSSGVPRRRSKYSHFETASIFGKRGSVGIAFWEGLYEGASTER